VQFCDCYWWPRDPSDRNRQCYGCRREPQTTIGSNTPTLGPLAAIGGVAKFEESRAALRVGCLKRLPPEYTGDRHVMVVRELPNQDDRECVVFEEMPGPAPDKLRCPARGRAFTGLRPSLRPIPTLRRSGPSNCSGSGGAGVRKPGPALRGAAVAHRDAAGTAPLGCGDDPPSPPGTRSEIDSDIHP
jgi:hypothetical protein